MSFHVGGHKPKQVDEPPKVRSKRRLWAVVCGVLVTLGGLYRADHARLMGQNYFGQPVHSTGLMMVGALFTLCCLIPTSWMEAAQREAFSLVEGSEGTAIITLSSSRRTHIRVTLSALNRSF